MMNRSIAISLIAVSTALASPVSAQTLATHRIPAVFAAEAVGVDADGATIATLRGDGAGIHSLDSAHDKAYTAVTFKSDTMALADRAKTDGPIAPLAKLPHILFFPGGIVIKLDNEVIGAIGAAGAPGGNLDDGCAKAGLEKIRDRLK